MFTLTPSAAEQISRAAEEQPDSPALRVAAKLDTDGEMVFGMGFDEEREDDQLVETVGVKVLIAPPSQPLLDEAVLDFVEVQPGEFQFVFMNAKAPSSCGSAGQSGSGGCGSCGSRSGGCS
jgi:iron-sulfur cluster assembly protein